MSLIYLQPLSDGRDIRAIKGDSGRIIAHVSKTLSDQLILSFTPLLHRFISSFVTRLNHGAVGQCVRAFSESGSDEQAYIIWDPNKSAILTYRKSQDHEEVAFIFTLSDLEQICQSLASIVYVISVKNSIFPAFIAQSLMLLSAAVSCSSFIETQSQVVVDPNTTFAANVCEFFVLNYGLALLPNAATTSTIPKSIYDLVDGVAKSITHLRTRHIHNP